MKKHFSSAVCMAALLLVAGAAAHVAVSPAYAQDVQVDFDTFHDQLAPYGDWVYSDRWGEVWIPTDVSDDFHPYGTRGHWVDTDDYGWTWVSDYEWGDIPFHYGRWVNDPDDGWMWIPGYVWSPGWVVWRHNGQYTGWMPLPPDDAFLGRSQPGVSVGINIGGLSISFGNEDDDYGYSRWYGSDYGQDRYAQNWVFVGTGHIADPDFRRYEAPRNNYTTIIHNTTNITNYTVVNNYIVNKSVDPRTVQQAGGHVQPVKLAAVMKHPQFITRADTGAQTQERARAERPRGTGFANSAPKPSAALVQTLSTKTPPARGGHAPMHLFTRDTIAKAPLAAAPAKPGEPVPPTPMETKQEKHGPAMGPAMTGPGMTAEPKHEKHGPEAAPAMTGPAAATEAKHPEHGTEMGPAMTGPATTTEPKHEKHGPEAAPAMTAPAPTTEPKHEKHGSETGPAMTGPGQTPSAPPGWRVKGGAAPATTPATEPKHEEHAIERPAATPAAAPAEPKREEHVRAPAVEHPAAAPVAHPVEHAAPAAAPKEPPKKHKKPGEGDEPH